LARNDADEKRALLHPRQAEEARNSLFNVIAQPLNPHWHRRSWSMDCFVAFAPRNDAERRPIQMSNSDEDMSPRSRGAVRRALRQFPPSRKKRRRESRVRAAPAVSCAKVRKKRTRAYRFSGGNPAFPARWLRLIPPLVSAKSARMCERAVDRQPPVAGSEPVRARRP